MEKPALQQAPKDALAEYPPEEGEHGALLHFQFWFGLSYDVLK